MGLLTLIPPYVLSIAFQCSSRRIDSVRYRSPYFRHGCEGLTHCPSTTFPVTGKAMAACRLSRSPFRGRSPLLSRSSPTRNDSALSRASWSESTLKYRSAPVICRWSSTRCLCSGVEPIMPSIYGDRACPALEGFAVRNRKSYGSSSLPHGAFSVRSVARNHPV